ncbi:MAG: hypothetical protein U0I48_01315 [Acutalibacteraceae bacterium]|nr:hypothetical protein [Acutalibacteraceae bacterium]
MLKIGILPVLMRMVSKLDLKPIIERLKKLDIFDVENMEQNSEAAPKITAEQAGELAFEIIAELTPQLDKIGEEIPEFVAQYEGISVEEAKNRDIFEVIKKLKEEKGIVNFLSLALKKTTGQKP